MIDKNTDRIYDGPKALKLLGNADLESRGVLSTRLMAAAPDLVRSVAYWHDRAIRAEATLEGYNRFDKCVCGDDDVCLLTLDRQRAERERDEAQHERDDALDETAILREVVKLQARGKTTFDPVIHGNKYRCCRRLAKSEWRGTVFFCALETGHDGPCSAETILQCFTDDDVVVDMLVALAGMRDGRPLVRKAQADDRALGLVRAVGSVRDVNGYDVQVAQGFVTVPVGGFSDLIKS